MDQELRVFNCIDVPDSRDFKFDDFLDFAEGWTDKVTKRPYDKLTVQDQWQIWACTDFACGHLSNANNINEYINNGYEYDQVDLMNFWNAHDRIPALQSAMKRWRTAGYIQWNMVVPKSINIDETVAKVRKVFSLWMWIYTWSADGMWNTWKAPYNYVKSTDGKRRGHARDIVDDQPSARRFVCLTSFWPKRWDKGYFYLPYEDLQSTYSLNAIIDKDDSGVFAAFKKNQVVAQWLQTAATKIYPDAPAQAKALFDQRQISHNLKPIYWLK